MKSDAEYEAAAEAWTLALMEKAPPLTGERWELILSVFRPVVRKLHNDRGSEQ